MNVGDCGLQPEGSRATGSTVVARAHSEKSRGVGRNPFSCDTPGWIRVSLALRIKRCEPYAQQKFARGDLWFDGINR